MFELATSRLKCKSQLEAWVILNLLARVGGWNAEKGYRSANLAAASSWGSWQIMSRLLSHEQTMSKQCDIHDQVMNKSWTSYQQVENKLRLLSQKQDMSLPLICYEQIMSRLLSHEQAMWHIWSNNEQVMKKWSTSCEHVETTKSWTSH